MIIFRLIRNLFKAIYKYLDKKIGQMNMIQKVLFVCCIFLIIITLLYPPYVGYNVIEWDNRNMPYFPGFYYYDGWDINWKLIFVQIQTVVAEILIFSFLMFVFKDRNKEKE